MEASHYTDPYLDYSMQGLAISDSLSALSKERSDGIINSEEHDARIRELAGQALSYLDEGISRFRSEFMLDVEAESLDRSLKGESKLTFALVFSSLLYESISDPLHPIDAISDTGRLQRAVILTEIADRLNGGNFYDRPNEVRAKGDAVIGRAILTMLSFNMDPRSLRLPYRN